MRLDINTRTEALLDAALRHAENVGWATMTRDGIATEAGVSFALVTQRLGTMDAIRRAVMRRAVQHRVVKVVAEGLVARDRHAARADDALRAECAALMERRA